MSTASPARTDPTAEPPSRLSAADRLRLIATGPAPFVSVHLETRAAVSGADADLERRWNDRRDALGAAGAPREALRAIDARLALPRPEHTAAIGVIAAADGRTVVDHAADPPRADHAVVDHLPYTAPLLEWDQRRVPHLAVVVDDHGGDIVAFGGDHRNAMATVPRAALPDAVVAQAGAIDARVIVVGGDREPAEALVETVTPRVAPGTRVVTEMADGPDEMAEAVVRQVSDVVATTTVELLREMRFLATHHAAVDGIDATTAALRAGTRGTLLIHDDPQDDRRITVGDDPIAPTLDPGGPGPDGRLVDACVLATLAAGGDVHVIPSTGPGGPDDGIALLPRPSRRPAGRGEETR